MLRKAGDTLHLILNIGEPTAGLFARAYLSSNGEALSTVDLVNDGECFSNHTAVMANVEQVLVKYKIFDDAEFTKENCEFPWATDTFDLDSLLPSQFSGAEDLGAELGIVDISVDMCGKLFAQMRNPLITAALDAPETFSATIEDPTIGGTIERDELTADLD